MLISAGSDDVVKCQDLKSKAITFAVNLPKDSHVTQLFVSQNGEYFAAFLGGYHRIEVRYTKNGEIAWSKKATNIFSKTVFLTNTNQVAAQILFTEKDKNKTVKLCFWNIANGEEQFRIDIDESIYTNAISPNDDLLASTPTQGNYHPQGIYEHPIFLMPLDQKKIAGELEGHLDRTSWMRFTSGGKRLVSLSEDSTAIIWDIEKWKNSQAR